jgi:hypothetical protein
MNPSFEIAYYFAMHRPMMFELSTGVAQNKKEITATHLKNGKDNKDRNQHRSQQLIV